MLYCILGNYCCSGRKSEVDKMGLSQDLRYFDCKETSCQGAVS